jgi:alkylation response protein AidB-like acyl-CoA dehydrogenase
LYDLRGLLTDDERMIQDSVGRFVDEKVLPIIQECFEKHHFPKEIIPEIADLGLLGSSIHGYDCAGLNAVSYGLICQELERGDSGIRSFVSVQSSLCMYPIYAFGSEGAEAALAARHGARQEDRLLRPDRIARRIGPGQHEDAREEERRRLGHQRLQDVDHQLAPSRTCASAGR